MSNDSRRDPLWSGCVCQHCVNDKRVYDERCHGCRARLRFDQRCLGAGQTIYYDISDPHVIRAHAPPANNPDAEDEDEDDGRCPDGPQTAA